MKLSAPTNVHVAIPTGSSMKVAKICRQYKGRLFGSCNIDPNHRYNAIRMMEIAVHADDLAVSVGLATPALPDAVLDPVFALLTRLSIRRHGTVALLRALSRAERAPASVTAF